MPSERMEHALAFKTLPCSSLRLPRFLFDPSGATEADATVMPPPVVCRTRGNGYTVVDGCKRLWSLRKRASAKIVCGILEKPLDKLGLALLRIRLNRGRQFSLREKLLYLRWLSRRCSPGKMETVLKDLGVTSQDGAMLVPLAFSDNETTVAAVAEGALHLALVRSFLLLSRKDQQAFLDAFRGARLSLQTQREFLEWLTEIVLAEKVPVARIFRQRAFQSVFRDTRLNWPQRIERTRALILARRFPLLSKVERAWRAAAAKANPAPEFISFIHSPFFERNRLEVRVTLASPKSAQAAFCGLAAVPEDTWNELLHPYSVASPRQ